METASDDDALAVDRHGGHAAGMGERGDLTRKILQHLCLAVGAKAHQPICAAGQHAFFGSRQIVGVREVGERLGFLQPLVGHQRPVERGYRHRPVAPAEKAVEKPAHGAHAFLPQ